MSRNVVYVCNAWIAPIPVQVAEIAPPLNHTADVGVRVKQGYHHRIVPRNEGNRHIEDVETVDSVTQVAAYQGMLAALLSALTSEEN